MVSVLKQINYIGLPKIGEYIEKGTSLAILETSKSAVEIYSPLTGKIEDINTQLETSSDLFNLFPETKGWLCLISSTEEELKDASLLSREDYYRHYNID